MKRKEYYNIQMIQCYFLIDQEKNYKSVLVLFFDPRNFLDQIPTILKPKQSGLAKTLTLIQFAAILVNYGRQNILQFNE